LNKLSPKLLLLLPLLLLSEELIKLSLAQLWQLWL